MIRKLRRKITGVIMAVTALVLLAVFAGVYFFSRANIADSYTYQLKQAVQTGRRHPGAGRRRRERRAGIPAHALLPAGRPPVHPHRFYGQHL